MTVSDFALFLIIPIGGLALGVWSYWLATRSSRKSRLVHKS
jgi:hypothetical protein